MNREDREALRALIINNEDLAKLEALMDEFNIFESLGHTRQEKRHSDFLVFLLDPAQNHGLGDRFLKRFLTAVLKEEHRCEFSALEADLADLSRAKVQRERYYTDILIVDEHNQLVCVIENKISSGEHGNQLERYRTTVTVEYPGYRRVFIYLTPDGIEPSHGEYLAFSYVQLAELLEALCHSQFSTVGPDVQTLLTHYVRMLRRCVVSDSEIAQLCQKIYRQHKRALDLIIEHCPDLQADLAEMCRALIHDAAEEHHLKEDLFEKEYIRFYPAEWAEIPAWKSAEGWTPSNGILLFEFHNYDDRLLLVLQLGPGAEETRNIIRTFMQDHLGLFADTDPELQEWTTLWREEILSLGNYQGANGFDVLVEKTASAWEGFLEKDLPSLREATKEMWSSISSAQEGE